MDFFAMGALIKHEFSNALRLMSLVAKCKEFQFEKSSNFDSQHTN